jgi:16S rRNA processing protein RimM
MVMDVLTDFPERLEPGAELWIGETHLPVIIRKTRWHGDALLISFQGIETPEAAGAYRNQDVYVSASSRPALEEGEYYYHELIGMNVISEDGTRLGILTEILETGANDVYVVRPEQGSEILLPAIDPVVLEINLDQKEMRVQVPPGLLPQGDVPEEE